MSFLSQTKNIALAMFATGVMTACDKPVEPEKPTPTPLSNVKMASHVHLSNNDDKAELLIGIGAYRISNSAYSDGYEYGYGYSQVKIQNKDGFASELLPISQTVNRNQKIVSITVNPDNINFTAPDKNDPNGVFVGSVISDKAVTAVLTVTDKNDQFIEVANGTKNEQLYQIVLTAQAGFRVATSASNKALTLNGKTSSIQQVFNNANTNASENRLRKICEYSTNGFMALERKMPSEINVIGYTP